VALSIHVAAAATKASMKIDKIGYETLTVEREVPFTWWYFFPIFSQLLWLGTWLLTRNLDEQKSFTLLQQRPPKEDENE